VTGRVHNAGLERARCAAIWRIDSPIAITE